MSGRARDGRLVHFAPGAVAASGPGDVVTTTVTYAAPHHLVADGPLVAHRRTRAGDNYAEGVRPRTSGVGLGLPSFGAPAPATGTGGRMRGPTSGEPDRRADIAGLRDEIDGVERDAERRAARTVELGGRAVVISVAVFVLIVGLVLPWMIGLDGPGGAAGHRFGRRGGQGEHGAPAVRGDRRWCSACWPRRWR